MPGRYAAGSASHGRWPAAARQVCPARRAAQAGPTPLDAVRQSARKWAASHLPLGELMLGVWLVPAVVAGLVIRRPGAALFTELVAANVELFLGNRWGAAVLLSGMLQGLGVELALALFRHRRFGVRSEECPVGKE